MHISVNSAASQASLHQDFITNVAWHYITFLWNHFINDVGFDYGIIH